ncbi:MAG: PilN domain-containing protein [Clostridiaceae bacterium]|nr:PilN domain-containing protein [Clostridiaceae bacterium]
MKDINFLVTEPLASTKEGAKGKQKSVPAVQIIIFILCLSIAVLALFIPGIMIDRIEKQISDVEHSMTDPKYAALRSAKADLMTITQVVDRKKTVIKDIDQKNPSASQILLLVKQAVPADCYIKSINFSGSTISLSGVAGSSIVYAEFVSNLDRLQQLESHAGALSMEQSLVPVEYSLQYTVKK